MKQREKDAIERSRKFAAERYDDEQLEHWRAQAQAAGPIRSLSEALSEDALGLIVEPKRATATRGVINESLDLAEIARTCQHAGAIAMSIVTEPELSHGSTDDLRSARAACELPLLARDFIVHPGQIYELRAAGADAVFIAVAAFEPPDDEDDHDELRQLVETAYALGMEAVLSVRSGEELAQALEADAEIINIDNRDDNGRIDVERTFDLLPEVPAGKTVISESVANGDEVAHLHRAGVDALLLDEGHVDTDLQGALNIFTELTLDGSKLDPG